MRIRHQSCACRRRRGRGLYFGMRRGEIARDDSREVSPVPEGGSGDIDVSTDRHKLVKQDASREDRTVRHECTSSSSRRSSCYAPPIIYFAGILNVKAFDDGWRNARAADLRSFRTIYPLGV